MMNGHNASPIEINIINNNNNNNSSIEGIKGWPLTPQAQPAECVSSSSVEYSVSPSNPRSRKRCCMLRERGARKRLSRHPEFSYTSRIVIRREEDPGRANESSAESMELDPCSYNNREEDQDPTDMIIVHSPSNTIAAADDDDHDYVMLDAGGGQISDSGDFSANQNMRPQGGSWHFLPCPNGNGVHSLWFA